VPSTLSFEPLLDKTLLLVTAFWGPPTPGKNLALGALFIFWGPPWRFSPSVLIILFSLSNYGSNCKLEKFLCWFAYINLPICTHFYFLFFFYLHLVKKKMNLILWFLIVTMSTLIISRVLLYLLLEKKNHIYPIIFFI
jgi:hypothetical protein